ncbi:hypothetical protein [Limnobacter sp.]|uniref:hypothetical protein n=1 Tax=Limnobacter sp. TaxID=2003368 RepID=UPI0031204C1E
MAKMKIKKVAPETTNWVVRPQVNSDTRVAKAAAYLEKTQAGFFLQIKKSPNMESEFSVMAGGKKVRASK